MSLPCDPNPTHRLLRSGVLGLLSLWLPACAPRNVSLSKDVAPLVQTSCTFATGCHGSSSPAGYVQFSPLTEPDGPSKLRERWLTKSTTPSGLALVQPGDPGHSFLFRKLQGDFSGLPCDPDHCGERMPLRNPRLPQYDIELIQQWITEGALDN